MKYITALLFFSVSSFRSVSKRIEGSASFWFKFAFDIIRVLEEPRLAASRMSASISILLLSIWGVSSREWGFFQIEKLCKLKKFPDMLV